MAQGVRLRLFEQATAVWARDWNPAHWIRTGQMASAEANRPRVEHDPQTLIARDQIRRDGGQVIPENIQRTIEAWRQSQETNDNGE